MFYQLVGILKIISISDCLLNFHQQIIVILYDPKITYEDIVQKDMNKFYKFLIYKLMNALIFFHSQNLR